MISPAPTAAAPKRQLTLFDSTSIIVGIIIGAGIYETTPLIARSVGSPLGLISFWLLGGLLSLIGALCYVELATAYPREGGDYVYLTRAFGRRSGFMFAWADLWIVRPGNIGMMACVFSRYANQLWPLQARSDTGAWGIDAYALSAVAVLGMINILGVRSGKWTQNTLATIKVVGLLAIFFVGVLSPVHDAAPASVLPAGATNFQLALVLVLFTYGGWNEMSYVAAEVRSPERNIFRALCLGSLTVTGVYVLVNLAFLRVLGWDGILGSKALAADAVRPYLGDFVAHGMSALVCLSCLGAINGRFLTGSRIYYALGTEHRPYRWLGRWSATVDAPVRALTVQTLVTLSVIFGFGSSEHGFERLLNFTSPVFWFFAFMVSLSLFVLRYREPQIASRRPVRGYPWTAIAFALFTSLLFHSSLAYALGHWSHIAYGALTILVVGFVISYVDTPRTKRAM